MTRQQQRVYKAKRIIAKRNNNRIRDLEYKVKILFNAKYI